MIIQNFNLIATDPLRKQALQIAESGLAAISTRAVVHDRVSLQHNNTVLQISSEKFPLSVYKRILVIAFGKVSLEAVTELHNILGDKISGGFVIDVISGNIPNVVCKVGTHPLPSLANTAATHELLEMLKTVTGDDLIINVVSGGGENLLCAPANITIEEEREITASLGESGATPKEVEIIRKHLSLVKGGQLAKLVYPATMINLIVSDLAGVSINSVAGGPTVMDDSTAHQAGEILKRYSVMTKLNLQAVKLTETPKEDKYFKFMHNIFLYSPQDALDAMKVKAHDLGFDVSIWNPAFSGEAQELGHTIARLPLKTGQCILAAGKVFAKVNSKIEKMGGRNQELALAALSKLSENSVLVAVDTDGYDNSSVAGAVVDSRVSESAKSLGLDMETALKSHESYQFFQETGVGLMTGMTGSNVGDLVVYLKQ